ncbi:MAG TPA: hypothetical protein VJK90_07990 [Acetobacteraceae bacterium]|jgi:hypothetical protein|nr:hypothetical protein [Acetobacteraceae bacterium]
MTVLTDPAGTDAVLPEGADRTAAIADPIVAEAERPVEFLRVRPAPAYSRPARRKPSR